MEAPSNAVLKPLPKFQYLRQTLVRGLLWRVSHLPGRLGVLHVNAELWFCKWVKA